MTAGRLVPGDGGVGVRGGAPRSFWVRSRTLAGQAIAAASFVVSAIVGLVTNLVTGQRGWGLAAGVVVLVLLVAGGAVLAWRLQGSSDGQFVSGPKAEGAVHGMGSVAPPWGLLPQRVRGRDSLIDELRSLLASPDRLVHVLSGLGGSGKTTIALSVADAVVRAGGQAWWISGRDRSSVDSGIVSLADALGVTGTEMAQARAGARSILDLVWERLDTATPSWVLVIDNADTPELLAAEGGRTRDGNGLARGSERGLTLVTSRYGDSQVCGDGAVIHLVSALEADDAADVLLDLSGPSAGSREEAAALASRLGCLPLALRASGRYLSSTTARLDGIRTFTAYRTELDARFTLLHGSALPDSDPRDIVMTTWDASLDLLAVRGHPGARPFMQIIGQFAAAPVPVNLLDPAVLAASGLFAPPRHQRRWPFAGRNTQNLGRHELHQVIAGLTAFGLLDMTDIEPSPRTGARRPCPVAVPCLVAHPLIVEVSALSLKQEKAMQQAAITAVLEMLSAAAQRTDPGSISDAATWPLLAPHVELLAASVPMLPPDDVIRFAVAAERVATGLRQGGEYTAALHLLVRAREAVGKLSGEHPAVLALRHSYAYVIDDLGQFEDAETEYRSILAARTRALGAEDPLTLKTRSHLAFALSRQRRHAEAEAEYRQVLQAQDKLLGPEHQDTLTTRNQLADVLYGQQRYDEAARHYEEVLDVQARLLGAEHPRTLTTRNSLARNRNRQGRHVEAEAEQRTILNLRRESRGTEHPNTLITWHDLAVSLASQGRSAEAITEFEGVLDARRRILGENHPDTLATAKELKTITSAMTPGS